MTCLSKKMTYLLALCAALLALNGCGGSGAGAAGQATVTTAGVTGSSVGKAGEKISIELVDQTTGVVVTTVPRTGAYIKVTVVTAAGAGISNRVISFAQGSAASAATGVLKFTPESALTNSSGIATSLVTPGNEGGGATSLSAEAVLVSGEKIKTQINVASAGSATGSANNGGAGATGPTLTLSIIDVASNTDKNSISLSSATQLRAVLKDGAGNPLGNQIVKFVSETAGVLTLTPAGTSLTDATGTATIFAAPSSISIAGAYAVSAEALLSDVSYKSVRSFSIGVSNLAISTLTPSAANISAYGTTTIAATVTGLPTGASVKVQFSSTCSTSGKAIITSSTDTINGVATATYKDNSCAGADTVTATVQGASASKSATVTSSPPAIANIGFISATPETIVLKGTGSAGASEVSIVKFRVFDQNGQPYGTATPVTLSLSTFTGGLKIDSGSVPVTKPSNGSGDVEVTVAAGTVPTPVTVTASITDPVSGVVRRTESTKLNVSTGRPSQNFFSLSSSKLNIEGWGYDGEKSIVTIRAADRLANPVPDGTGVNFIAEGASIQSSCQTTGGACSVEFVSQESRPREGDSSLSTSISRTDSGRVTIVAYSIGEESFIDLNGNNLYEVGEPFTDLGYIFIDNLETALYNAARHQVIPYTNPEGSCVNPPFGIFSAPSKPDTCDGVWGAAHVRRAGVLVLSGSTPRLAAVAVGGGPTTYGVNSVTQVINVASGACFGSVDFYLQDINGNPMAEGTVLAADVTVAKDVTAAVGATPIAASTNRGGTYNFITVSGTKDETTGVCKGSGQVKLTVTSTKGVVSSYGFTVNLVP